MASTFVYGFLTAVLLLQSVTANPIGGILSPLIDVVCKDVDCGKGDCKASANNTILFECVCHPGWKQTFSSHEDNLKFLPCVIPNCTLNRSCAASPSSVQEKASKSNDSIFDPCYWSHCGGGSCNKTSKFTYNCECSEGYYNLLNTSYFPCFKECEIGMDCANLGINMTNKTSTSSPAVADNQATGSSTVRLSFWPVIMIVFMAMIPWEYV
ncbi:uncharacterized protein LOC107407422 [Ziziphus jujuba]|uniref:Uncharacterized protein LOC107407422 n=2 Tax=Ziziphus jujuba TaxID=326968 RepID=A0A6P3Z0W4_ZIZJJ|nr:uncharacterized protein LOC107407422 [Ziziphus jujuba]KAH7522266.1 hypothetical protein FEM48_Zijuj07G0120200 [Ziziphus jujuba var. spinosa]